MDEEAGMAEGEGEGAGAGWGTTLGGGYPLRLRAVLSSESKHLFAPSGQRVAEG